MHPVTAIVDPIQTLTEAAEAIECTAQDCAVHLPTTWIPGVLTVTGHPAVYAVAPGGQVAGPVPVLTVMAPQALPAAELAAVAQHAALWCPNTARALAEALRAVLRLHRPAGPPHTWMCATCGEVGQGLDCTFPCDTLRTLAQGVRAILHEAPTTT